MLILSQKGNVMVNMDSLQAITIYIFRNYQNGKIVDEKYRVMAWYGADEDDYWAIGDYATEERAKEVIKEIREKYGEYLHRRGGPAILKGSVDVPEAFWVLPKIYEMPQE